jgi:hypothetical protein
LKSKALEAPAWTLTEPAVIFGRKGRLAASVGLAGFAGSPASQLPPPGDWLILKVLLERTTSLGAGFWVLEADQGTKFDCVS